jgi:hypothetical protein
MAAVLSEQTLTVTQPSQTIGEDFPFVRLNHVRNEDYTSAMI